MEFLKLAKRRSFLSELIYIVLNVALAIALLIAVRTVDSPLPAFGIVLLGKWRIFAVRPRYWFANIQANLVDIIVSLSVVVFLYTASGVLALQAILTLLYVVWLLFVKPRSKRGWIAAQAAIATFLGVAALSMVSPDWPVSIVVILTWVIGFSAARHVLSSYDESHILFYSLAWGFVIAELGWLTYHWTFGYGIPGLGHLLLPQNAIIMLAISFMVERAYASYHRHGTVKSSDILLPCLLSVSIILVLVIAFNRPIQ